MEENTVTPRLSIGFLLIYIVIAGVAFFATAGVAALVPLSITLISQSNGNPCPGIGTTTITCSFSGLTIGKNYLITIGAFTHPFTGSSTTCTDAQGFTTYTIQANQKTQCTVLLTTATATTDTVTVVSTASWQGDSDQLFSVTG